MYTDKEVPNFEVCPDNQTLNTQPGQAFAVAFWQDSSINVSDNSGDMPNVTCNWLSGSRFTIGQTLVTCKAIDSSGNINTCSFQILVEGLCWRSWSQSFT